MNRVVIGLLMGVGVVSGLAVLLLRGEKTQRFLRERWQQLRRTLPEPEHVQQDAQHVADRLSQATSEVKDTTQQLMKRVRVAGSDLSDVAQQEVRLGS
jgi:gas vesicle protein